MKSILVIFIIFFAALLFSPKSVSGSEGTVELRSTSAPDHRCFVASLKMQDQNYRVLVSCRDLIYPGGETVYTYIVWANPIGGGSPFKLGELGFGKVDFRTREAFTGLFVTTEENSRVRSPEGPVVMRGAVETINFLDRPQSPTPTPEGEAAEEEEVAEEEKPSAGQRLLTALRRAGIVILLALAAVMGLVFVLTRSKT